MERVGDGRHLGLQVFVVEEVLRSCHVHHLGGELVECVLESLPGDLEGGCHELVAVLDCLAEELAVVRHYHQSVLRLVFGVEQTDVHPVVAELEVVLQHAVVEQQLHIVGLQLVAVVGGVRLVPLDVHVPARLLLHEQPAVGGHEVHAALDAQCLAYERGLQDGFLAVVGLLAAQGVHLRLTGGAGKEDVHHLLQVVGLLVGVGVELLAVEPGAGAKLQCLLPEVALHGVVRLILALAVDDVVEGCSGEVTEQGGLGVGARLHLVEEVEQGMVAEVGEAGGDAADVDQVVGLHHDEARRDDGLAHLAVEQVELHPFPEQFAEVGVVEVVLLVLQLHEVFLLVGILVDVHAYEVAVPALHDAAYAAVVDFQSLGLGAVGVGDEHGQLVGHVRAEHG